MASNLVVKGSAAGTETRYVFNDRAIQIEGGDNNSESTLIKVYIDNSTADNQILTHNSNDLNVRVNHYIDRYENLDALERDGFGFYVINLSFFPANISGQKKFSVLFEEEIRENVNPNDIQTIVIINLNNVSYIVSPADSNNTSKRTAQFSTRATALRRDSGTGFINRLNFVGNYEVTNNMVALTIEHEQSEELRFSSGSVLTNFVERFRNTITYPLLVSRRRFAMMAHQSNVPGLDNFYTWDVNIRGLRAVDSTASRAIAADNSENRFWVVASYIFHVTVEGSGTAVVRLGLRPSQQTTVRRAQYDQDYDRPWMTQPLTVTSAGMNIRLAFAGRLIHSFDRDVAFEVFSDALNSPNASDGQVRIAVFQGQGNIGIFR